MTTENKGKGSKLAPAPNTKFMNIKFAIIRVIQIINFTVLEGNFID